MKEGNPFGPFWDELGVDFDQSEFTGLGNDVYNERILKLWNEKYTECTSICVGCLICYEVDTSNNFHVSSTNCHKQDIYNYSVYTSLCSIYNFVVAVHIPCEDQNFLYHLSMCRYPPDTHPVLAFKGAPASFPVQIINRPLQQYVVWNSHMQDWIQSYVETEMSGGQYIAVHLRIGSDWVSITLLIILYYTSMCKLSSRS